MQGRKKICNIKGEKMKIGEEKNIPREERIEEYKRKKEKKGEEKKGKK